MLFATSRRRSPSMRMSLAATIRSMIERRRPTSSSLRSLVRLLPSMFAFLTTFSAVVLPIPVMYVRAITTRLAGGMSTPAILAISLLTLPLFVFGRLGADHADHPVALDHLAAGTHLSDRRTYFHLQISRIRPRDRSLSASSTPTLSPARSRVKWVPARSATWARTFAPFSSSTRQTPLGRGSTTTPFTSGGRWGTNGEYTKGRNLAPCPSP